MQTRFGSQVASLVRSLITALVWRTATAFAWLASLTLVVIMLLTFTDVIGRSFFGRSLIGTVESIELLMGVLVFSGLAFTELNRKHIVIETFQSLFPRPVHRLSVIINSLLAVVITGFLAWQLFIKTSDVLAEQEYTQILHIPYWPTAIVMSMGIGLFLLVLLLRLIDDCLGPKA